MDFGGKKVGIKKKLAISSCFIITVIAILLINNFIITNIFKNKNNGMKNKLYSLSIKDFNDDVVNEEDLYIDENRGFLASSTFYTANGRNMRLSYDLFESEYKWIVNWNFNKMMEWFESQGIVYTEIQSSLPDFIKVYTNQEGNNYILLSDNKIIEVIGLGEEDKDKIIDIVYNKIFKDTKEELV